MRPVRVLADPLPPSFDPRAFRALARREMSARFGTPLAPLRLAGCFRPFDLASEDATLVGCVLPPARRGGRTMSTTERAELSEAVLLLSLTPAQQRVLVVPYDRERLAPWLAVYGHLARDVEIWHLGGPGRLERVTP